ncbi:MAG TPA: Rieske (2Fe-2S) protein [Sedimenticola sp.]|nr:Rieske (2Fe-2S) protein [Sedimenticola sp.]
MPDRLLQLARLADIPDPGSKGFSLAIRGGALEGFLVRRGGRVTAWRNSCPHTGAPLDWTPDRFLDPAGRHIQCALHGARFDTATGRCLHGPCLGEYLDPLPLVIENGAVYLALAGGAG